MLSLLLTSAASAMTLLVTATEVDRDALRSAIALRCPDAGPEITLTVTDRAEGGLSLVLMDRSDGWSDAWTIEADSMQGTDLDRATAVATCNRHVQRVAAANGPAEAPVPGLPPEPASPESASPEEPSESSPVRRTRRPRRPIETPATIDETLLRLHAGFTAGTGSRFVDGDWGSSDSGRIVDAAVAGARISPSPLADIELRYALSTEQYAYLWTVLENEISLHAAFGSPFRARLHRGVRARVGLDLDTIALPGWEFDLAPAPRHFVPALAGGVEYAVARQQWYGRASAEVLFRTDQAYSVYGVRWWVVMGYSVNKRVAIETELFVRTREAFFPGDPGVTYYNQTLWRGGLRLAIWLDPMPLLEPLQNPDAPRYDDAPTPSEEAEAR